MPQQQGSKLDAYVNNYGARLQSLLAPQTAEAVTDTAAVGVPSALEPQQEMRQTGAMRKTTPEQRAAGVSQQMTPDQRSMLEEPVNDPALAQQPPKPTAAQGGPGKAQGDGLSVRQAFKDLPDEEQQKQASDLKDALKRGGTNVDEAYDTMIKQMGTRPDDKLDEKEKSMLLIEFGLNLMVNSSGKNYGEDLSGALGATGLNSMDSYQRTKGARQRQWDTRRSALEEGRANDKATLAMQATKSELEADSKLPREFAPTKQNQDVFAGGDGFMYQMIDGKTTQVKDENGKPVMATKKDLDYSQGGKGGTEKTFEYDHRADRWMAARGYKFDGTPLSDDLPPLKGKELRKLQQQAIDAAGDTKNSALSDEEITQQAQRAVDEQMRFSSDLYRDYTPQQYEAERSRLVKGRITEIKSGRTQSPDAAAAEPAPQSALNSTPEFLRKPSALEPGAGAPPASALKEGKITRFKNGQKWTLRGGKPVKVP